MSPFRSAQRVLASQLIFASVTFFWLLQVSFIGEDWEQEQLLQQQGQRSSSARQNSYTAERGLTPSLQPQLANGRQSSCDPVTMNGNGPPNRLRPPPGPGGTVPKRSPSLESSQQRPPGAPPRQRPSRTTPLSPEEMALRTRQEEAAGVRDCFIIPQQSVERFLPDGISVRKSIFKLRFCGKQ